MGGKCDYNNSVEKIEQDSQSGAAPDRRINTMANCAIVGINWGDEGKGRMVDYLTDHYDVVVRYQGGGNAGHTVVNEKGKFALHLLPSGIFRDGVVNILGNGVALDCENLLKEMETLRAAGVIITPENLKVSDRASLLLPWHRELDALEEARLADKKYGSTKQGIAPFYGDKYQKKTVQAGELLHPEHLKEHLADLLEWKNLMLQKIYGAKGYTMDELMAWVNTYCGAIKPYITDTGRFLRNAQKEGKSILFEAQLGALRDLDYGIHLFECRCGVCARRLGPSHGEARRGRGRGEGVLFLRGRGPVRLRVVRRRGAAVARRGRGVRREDRQTPPRRPHRSGRDALRRGDAGRDEHRPDEARCPELHGQDPRLRTL